MPLRTNSRLTTEALALLGKQIKLARRRMSEKEIAARVGIARSTLQKVDQRDPQVEIGLMFEAATIAGVSLFDPEKASLAPKLERIDDKIALLPQSIRKARKVVHDDF